MIEAGFPALPFVRFPLASTRYGLDFSNPYLYMLLKFGPITAPGTAQARAPETVREMVQVKARARAPEKARVRGMGTARLSVLETARGPR